MREKERHPAGAASLRHGQALHSGKLMGKTVCEIRRRSTFAPRLTDSPTIRMMRAHTREEYRQEKAGAGVEAFNAAYLGIDAGKFPLTR